MSDRLYIAVSFRLGEEALSRIRAVDRRIEILDCSTLGRREPTDGEQRAQLLEHLAKAEILFGPNRFPAEYADAARRLKWFQVINAGIDRMAKEGLLGRDFVITTASGLSAAGIAEYAIGMMVALAKGIHLAVRAQSEHRWESRGTLVLQGKTLGIVGLGEIGRQTARRARAFGMRIVASRRTVAAGTADPDCDELLAHSDLPGLLSQSDYVLVCVPLTAETRHLFREAEFATMKRSACLINVARGEVIDQLAMIEALQRGTIAGAGLDVFDPEPLPAESPLWDMANVIITPHNSGSVERYAERATSIFIANLSRYLAGEPLSHVVDAALGY